MSSFLPAFFILFIALMMIKRNSMQIFQIKQKRRKEAQSEMDNSALLRYVGKECIIQANGYISGLTGKIADVSGNWITIEDKKGKLTTFNCDYISSIKEK